jgi:hypothetical protein
MSVPQRVSTAPTGAARHTSISPAKRQLLNLFEDVQFGRLIGLIVRDGEPIFDPAPTVVRTLKFGAAGNPHRPTGDPASRPAVTELFAHFTLISNGVVHKIQIADGLPLLAEIEEQAHL